MNEESLLFPITAWDIGPVPSQSAVTFRPHFLDSRKPQQEPLIGIFYMLTPAQARELGEALIEQSRRVENASFLGPPDRQQ